MKRYLTARLSATATAGALLVVTAVGVQTNAYQDAATVIQGPGFKTLENVQIQLQSRNQFLGLMEALGKGRAPSTADGTPEAEVIRIAIDRRLNRSLYTEIEEQYVNQYDPRVRAPRAYPPSEKHTKERYRLAWEYLLLRGPFMGGAPGYAGRALEALSKIHNDASLPLIVRKFSLYNLTYLRDPSTAGQIQEKYLNELAGFVSPNGLEALIDCANAANVAQKGVAIPDGFGVDGTKIIRDILKPRRPNQRSIAWEPVILEFERNPAKRGKMQLLKRILTGPGSLAP